MGGAASVNLADEVAKPMDASDLPSKDDAVKEVARLRAMIAASSSPPAKDIDPNYGKFYVVINWNFENRISATHGATTS